MDKDINVTIEELKAFQAGFRIGIEIGLEAGKKISKKKGE